MKRLLLLLCLAFGLSFTFEAAANESFLLTIPLREDLGRLTGEARVTLGLSAPPAGSQLVIAETTTINLGQTVTLNGDSITYEAGTGNQARIIYRVLSNFTMPNNFCVSSLNIAAPKEVPIRFVGSQDIVDYRMASYAVGAPEVECSKPFKRVGDFPAFLTPFADATTPELSAVNKNRDHLDVILVLDKSGSMAGLPPEAETGATKAAILRSATEAFIAQWRAIDGPTEESPLDFQKDRIGLVFFDSTAVPQQVGGAFFVERGPGGPGPTHQWNPVVTQVTTLNPGGSTTIGGGINSAFQQWSSDPDHDLTLIVVTDGMQNSAPLIERIANNILTLAPVGTFVPELRKRFTPIFTVGFGVPAAVDHALLSDISLQTTGQSYVAIGAQTMFSSFGETLVQFIKGNTVSLALQENETMTGAGPSAAHPVIIDRSVPRMVASVQWAPPLVGVLDLEVIGPDGTRRTATTSESTGQAVVQSFDIRPTDAGQWSVRVRRGQSTATQTIPYTLTAFLSERSLEYQVSAGQVTTGTGEDIKLRATIAYDHKALNKLPGGAVRVRVQRPAEALGTILHDTRADDAPAGANGDTMTPYEQKLAALTNASLLQRVYPRDAEIITLTEEKPGVYTGTVTNTSTPGMYAFEAVLEWDDPRTGRVRRVERLEKHVRVKPEPEATVITTTRDGADRTLVTVTPRDRFGNYVGPGYASDVRATLNGPGSISTTAVDADQTGTYTFTVTGVPAGETPDVDVTFGGADIGNTRGGFGSGGKWRLFLDVGKAITHGGRRAYRDGVYSLNAGLERILTPHISIEAIFGYHRFKNSIDDPTMFQYSLGGKYWFGTGTCRPFVDASVGAYYLHPANNTRFGASAGGGLLYQLTPNLGLEGVYHFTNVNTEADSVSFSSVQGGVRFSW